MNTTFSVDRRVAELIDLYSSPTAQVCSLLCDSRPEQAPAYRIIDRDLRTSIVSYGELKKRSGRMANALRAHGIGKGDRVATLMGKSADYLFALLAIWRLGAVHVPLFTAFAAPAVHDRLQRCGAKAIFVDAANVGKLALTQPNAPLAILSGGRRTGTVAFQDLLAQPSDEHIAVAVGGNAPLIQMYTSGTTGSPKCVVVPVKAMASFHAYAELSLGLSTEDMFWNGADPGWAFGLFCGVLASLTTGIAGTFLDAAFTPETTWTVLANLGITNFAAAPTVYRSLMTRPTPSGLRLRRLSSCGEPLTPDINRWSESNLGLSVHDHYGQTETGILLNNHHHPALVAPIKPGSMGRAFPGWKLEILHYEEDRVLAAGETGRIAADLTASPLAWFDGYLGDEGKTAEKFSKDGRWYLTGDVGYREHDGYFYFRSREDDIILMAGYRIGPAEVEAVVLSHPAVRECAAVAVPDAVRGEVLECAVVLNSGHVASDALTFDIQQWVKSRYAAHAYPRRIHFVEALPKTPSGKIQRFHVRELCLQRSG